MNTQYSVSITDLIVLVKVYKLLDKGEPITRKKLIKDCGVCPTNLTRRIKNLYKKEKILKDLKNGN